MKLKLNNIEVLYAITFFAALYFYHPIATLYYQARGLSFVEINSLWAIIVGVMAIAEVPTGILADKIGRKFSINLWVNEGAGVTTGYLEYRIGSYKLSL